ncbi:DUF1150 family protein [Niveispirillum sp.]|uniref:DUF1150 family protein n=1 Tax=Niveispirillum sp. TaxID=1917217 RepID=UPI001B4E33DD|nr:DUF1150 family protein [Niveispirillum sp.]MBP7335309.1 DUF1150 family protein [Niveispirillum sp.]
MNPTTQYLRRLSPKDFAAFGVNDLAYVKPTETEGKPAYAIHAADGTILTVVERQDVAFATVRQHDMEPLSLQ